MTTSPTSQPPAKNGNGSERRPFLVRVAALVTGGLVALFPFAAGFGVITDPWRRGRRKNDAGDKASEGDASAAKLVRICPLAALPADGVPHAFPVVSDVVDGWTRDSNQRIGMIYLLRTEAGGKSNVVALSAECPHLGCYVDFNPADKHFECPCHKSAFGIDGAKLYGPSRRGLDSLPVELASAGSEQEVMVAFQRFQKGIEERKPAE